MFLRVWPVALVSPENLEMNFLGSYPRPTETVCLTNLPSESNAG